MTRAVLITACASALVVAGCGGGKSSTMSSTDTAMKKTAVRGPAATPAATGTRVKTVGSKYGTVLADARGEALYLFAKEKSGRSRCYGACAKVWPPVLTKGRPRAGKGSRSRLLGTTRRRNGKLQVTYAGRPLYYFEGDSPGKILCQNVSEFGGRWLVVRPNGRPVS